MKNSVIDGKMTRPEKPQPFPLNWLPDHGDLDPLPGGHLAQGAIHAGGASEEGARHAGRQAEAGAAGAREESHPQDRVSPPVPVRQLSTLVFLETVAKHKAEFKINT